MGCDWPGTERLGENVCSAFMSVLGQVSCIYSRTFNIWIQPGSLQASYSVAVNRVIESEKVKN